MHMHAQGDSAPVMPSRYDVLYSRLSRSNKRACPGGCATGFGQYHGIKVSLWGPDAWMGPSKSRDLNRERRNSPDKAVRGTKTTPIPKEATHEAPTVY